MITIQRKIIDQMTDEQRDVLTKAITKTVIHSLEPQWSGICHHEAGHVVCGTVLGMDLESVHAGLSEGLTLMSGVKIGYAANVAWVTMALAGSEAVKLRKALGRENAPTHPWVYEPSDGDMKIVTDAIAQVQLFSNESKQSIIESSKVRAQTILRKYWNQVEEVASRLRDGKSLSSIQLYLTCCVSREPF